MSMDLDTGAPCGIISYNNLRKIKSKFVLKKSDKRFTSFTGHKVNCIGYIIVTVSVRNLTKKLKLYVVEGNFDSLFGRKWISEFVSEIDFCSLFSNSSQVNAIKTDSPHLSLEQSAQLNQLLNRFADAFGHTAGKISGPPAKVHFKSGATPVFS